MCASSRIGFAGAPRPAAVIAHDEIALRRLAGGTRTCTSLAGKPASRNRFAIASAALRHGADGVRRVDRDQLRVDLARGLLARRERCLGVKRRGSAQRGDDQEA